MAKTPETIRDQVENAISSVLPKSPQDSGLPLDDILFHTVCIKPGLDIPVILAGLPGRDPQASRVLTEAVNGRDRLRVSIADAPGFTAGYKEKPGARAINLTMGESEQPWIKYAKTDFNLGTVVDKAGQERIHALTIAAMKGDTRYDPTSCTDKPVLRVNCAQLPVGWEDAIRNGRLLTAQGFEYVSSGQEATILLKTDPKSGFAALVGKAQRLPLLTKKERAGYHPGHNENPVRLSATESELRIRFLYVNTWPMVQLAAAGELTQVGFLEQCVLPKAGPDGQDDVNLTINLTPSGKIATSIAITRPDPKNLVVSENSLFGPQLQAELAAVELDSSTLMAGLQEILSTPSALGRLFAVLSPRKEEVKDTYISGYETRLPARLLTPADHEASVPQKVKTTPHSKPTKPDRNGDIEMHRRGSKYERKEKDPHWKSRGSGPHA